MQDTTYNGWKNYETWACALWIDNDEGSHLRARELTREAWDESEDGGNPFVDCRSDRARILLCDALEGWVEEDMIPDLGACFAADLLGSALSEVDFHELADHYLGDYADGYEQKPCATGGAS